jgi:hypothetical protein
MTSLAAIGDYLFITVRKGEHSVKTASETQEVAR